MMIPVKRLFCPIVFMAIILISSSALAQTDKLQGVLLNDGTVIRGKVIQQNVEQVTIQELNGKISVHKFSDVKSFLREGEDESIKTIRKKTTAAESDEKMTLKVSKPENPQEKVEIKEVAEAKPTEKVTSKALLPLHSFEIAPEISYIKYEEPGVMEEKGMMYGISASYAYHDKLMFKAQGKFSFGLLNYEGSTWGGTPLNIEHIPNYLWEFRGLVGYDITVFKSTVITPYLGIGYRYLNDNPQEKYAFGYKRETHYLYSPIGLEVFTKLNEQWSLGAEVEYDVFLWGRQKSHFDYSNPGTDVTYNVQRSGYGVRGAVRLVRKGERIGFVLEPYVKYWSIDESSDSEVSYMGFPIGLQVIEPKNRSTEIGCKLAIMF